MAQITKDTIIGDILDIAPETVEQACMVHGVEVEELLAKINASVAAAQ